MFFPLTQLVRKYNHQPRLVCKAAKSGQQGRRVPGIAIFDVGAVILIF
jgi:hypothetical protein